MPENGDLLFDVTFEPFDSCEFHGWSDLPCVLKIKILQYLPYPTIRHFMLLSKESYILASKAKIQAESVRFREQSYRTEMFGMPGEKNRLDLVVCWMPPDKQLLRSAHKKYRLSFAEDPNGGCYVEKIRKKKGRVSVTRGVHYDEDTYTTAMRVLLGIARFLDILTVEIQLRSLYPQIERVLKEEPSSTTLCSDTFDIRTEDRELVNMFIPFLRPKCRWVIFSHGIVEPDRIFLQTPFFDSDVVRAARDMYIDVKTGITDSQMTKLEAPVLRISSPYLSAWSINKLILQWLEGKRKITFVHIRATRELPKNEVFRDIDPAVLLRGGEASDGRGYDPALYTLVRSDHGDLVVYLDTDYCNLSDPFQFSH
ncbi:hypothetical protein Y032_0011g1562 [Ancylostoma ceylanicum]|nr:hypothetical protein Y032_0011g1562 [Ancylostoma ceylanicum]